ARARPRHGRDEEMHALHRSHLQREPGGGRARAGLRRDLPGLGAAFRRPRRSGLGRLASRRRARRLRSHAGDGLPADQQIPAASAAQGGQRGDGRAGRAGADRAGRRIPRLARQAPQRLDAPVHPAASVILFTTTSGAGYGLLALLGLLGPAGLVPQGRWFGFAGLGLALALITAGLLASTSHLGRPERAWRAVSQWRSSWL